MLKSADFDLDYLNKVVVPNSSFSKAEAVDGGVSDSPLAAKNIVSQSKQSLSKIGDEEEGRGGATDHGLQVPVDKGIFRRKLNIVIPHDVETGVNHDDKGAESGDESKGNKPNMTIAQKLLAMVGLQPQQPSGRSMRKMNSIKHQESFVEHRKSILQKWKDNIKNKMPKQKSSLSEDEKETEVRDTMHFKYKSWLFSDTKLSIQSCVKEDTIFRMKFSCTLNNAGN
jgi:hypothetical protein